MDPEEQRVLYLARVGREKIFKYGTYTVTQQRPITQDHPFYEKRDDTPADDAVPYGGAEAAMQDAQGAAPVQDSYPVPEETADPGELASQIMSNNFKVGLSQEEVDALLNGM